MIMRAKQEGNVVVFELEGNLDFETIVQFENACERLIEQSAQTQRLVFNMEKLKFVGSSGINQFVRVLKNFNTLPVKPKYIHVSSEFEKIFRALQTVRNPFDIFENEAQAIVAFDTDPPPSDSPRRLKRKGNA